MFSIKKVSPNELDTLLAYSKSTFYEFFAHLNDHVNFEAYVAVAFKPEKMLGELTDPDSEFYFAVNEDEIAGYIKLNTGIAQNEFKHDNGLEVERIYVSGGYHGKGIGKQLLDFGEQRAAEQQKGFIWLGVWEHNHKALAFYQRQGYEYCGSHDFMLGDDRQTDMLMRKNLNTIYKI